MLYTGLGLQLYINWLEFLIRHEYVRVCNSIQINLDFLFYIDSFGSCKFTIDWQRFVCILVWICNSTQIGLNLPQTGLKLPFYTDWFKFAITYELTLICSSMWFNTDRFGFAILYRLVWVCNYILTNQNLLEFVIRYGFVKVCSLVWINLN